MLVTLPVRAGPPDPPLVVGDHRSVELVNLGGPTSEALLTRVAVHIGAAVAAVEAFWGTDWPHQIVVTATGSDRQFATEAGGGSPAQWSDVAAVATADRVDPGHRLAVGQRVLLAPGAAAMSTAALRIVLTHELFHYAARADTAFDAPRWLTEGVADFVARAAPTSADRPAPPLALPSDTDLDTAGPKRAQAYDRAWWFARFVAESYGTAKLREFYLAACGPGHADPATAVQQTLGVGLPAVLTGWQRWLASQR
ncbi:MAG TPA: hypothetical protein VFQ37_10995 [Mycobacterium sp.]|nr:hypothetical protein [Mycobacterium sp.]